MQSLLAQWESRERTSEVDTHTQLCHDCEQSVLEAFAQLRSLIRSYLRGEIEYEAFATMAGELQLRHDIDIANRKMDVQLQQNAESGGSGAGRHRLQSPTYQWPAADVPVVDVEDACMQPAAHDGTGDCGCPAIGED